MNKILAASTVALITMTGGAFAAGDVKVDIKPGETATISATTGAKGHATVEPTTAERTPGDHTMTPILLPRQLTTQTLSSEMIGVAVMGADGQTIGDVNDLIVDKEGKITGVIIGVGGFLGVGEKNVAVSYSAMDRVTDANGATHLSVKLTKEALMAADPYVNAPAKG